MPIVSQQSRKVMSACLSKNSQPSAADLISLSVLKRSRIAPEIRAVQSLDIGVLVIVGS